MTDTGERTKSTPGSSISCLVGIGLDVGQKVDPSALAVAELRWVEEEGAKRTGAFYVRHLEAMELGTSWADVAQRTAYICDAVANRLYVEWAEENQRRQIKASSVFVDEPGLKGYRSPPRPEIFLRIDATGVGSPIVELVEGALFGRGKQYTRVQPCFFTHGDRINRSSGTYTVGKGFLVGRLKALQQSGLLKIAPGILDVEAVIEEFLDYEIRVDENANDKYGAFKVGAHDDRVTALGLAVLQTPGPQRYAGAVSVNWT